MNPVDAPRLFSLGTQRLTEHHGHSGSNTHRGDQGRHAGVHSSPGMKHAKSDCQHLKYARKYRDGSLQLAHGFQYKMGLMCW